MKKVFLYFIFFICSSLFAADTDNGIAKSCLDALKGIQQDMQQVTQVIHNTSQQVQQLPQQYINQHTTIWTLYNLIRLRKFYPSPLSANSVMKYFLNRCIPAGFKFTLYQGKNLICRLKPEFNQYWQLCKTLVYDEDIFNTLEQINQDDVELRQEYENLILTRNSPIIGPVNLNIPGAKILLGKNVAEKTLNNVVLRPADLASTLYLPSKSLSKFLLFKSIVNARNNFLLENILKNSKVLEETLKEYKALKEAQNSILQESAKDIFDKLMQDHGYFSYILPFTVVRNCAMESVVSNRLDSYYQTYTGKDTQVEKYLPSKSNEEWEQFKEFWRKKLLNEWNNLKPLERNNYKNQNAFLDSKGYTILPQNPNNMLGGISTLTSAIMSVKTEFIWWILKYLIKNNEQVTETINIVDDMTKNFNNTLQEDVYDPIQNTAHYVKSCFTDNTIPDLRKTKINNISFYDLLPKSVRLIFKILNPLTLIKARLPQSLNAAIDHPYSAKITDVIIMYFNFWAMASLINSMAHTNWKKYLEQNSDMLINLLSEYNKALDTQDQDLINDCQKLLKVFIDDGSTIHFNISTVYTLIKNTLFDKNEFMKTFKFKLIIAGLICFLYKDYLCDILGIKLPTLPDFSWENIDKCTDHFLVSNKIV